MLTRLGNMPRTKKKTFFKKVFLWTIISGMIGSGVFFLWIASFKMPDLQSFDERKITQSTKIYDRTGEILLYDVHDDIRRTVIPFDEISRHVKNATVAIEDAQFYEHKGIRPIATFRAVFIQPLRGKGVQGGSTITQQVIKNALLTTEKTISRKLKEWVLAFRLEKLLSKEEILAQYLNEVPYGGNIYGVEEASQMFFGKSAKELTIAESAYLAALPQAPTFYSPYGNNREALEDRKDLVLARMQEELFISQKEHEEALAEEVVFLPRPKTGISAPHFVFYVIEQLEQQYGKRAIEEDGLKVITTIDLPLQERAEEIVKDFALKNAETFDAENASLVAVDPKNGDILVMVGSRDYFDQEIDGNFNVALAKRQPGSAFKPFVYATAFKKGYTPETVLFDLQTQFSTSCSPTGEPLTPNASCYMPQNYDNQFRGPINLRNALAQSVNIPAIKILYLSGLQESLQTARDLGISTLSDVNQYGLTLVLGGGEVTPLEITSAYSVFANDGIRNPYRSILRIEDQAGNIIEERSLDPRREISEKVARQISDILSDNVARTPLFGANSLIHFTEHDVAVKTGTTNDYRDAWIIGYTPTIAVGAWAGNNDNSPMNNVAGLRISPLWRAFMDAALEQLPNESFEEPPLLDQNIKPVLRGIWQGGVTYTIDTMSGKLATQYTPEETKKEFAISDVHSVLYWVDPQDPRGNPPKDPNDSPQFLLWEYGVLKWAAENNITQGDPSTIPTEKDDIHTKETQPKLELSGIETGVTYPVSGKIHVTVKNTGVYPLSKVDFFFNEHYIGSARQNPFSFVFTLADIDTISAENTLRVVATDSVYNRGEITKTIRVGF